MMGALPWHVWISVTRYAVKINKGPISSETEVRASILLYDDTVPFARLDFRDTTQSIPDAVFGKIPVAYYPMGAFAGILAILGAEYGVMVMMPTEVCPPNSRMIVIKSAGAVTHHMIWDPLEDTEWMP